MTTARDALCVALDGSDRSWILETARALAGEVGWLKIGLEAFTAHGPPLVASIAELGCPVFLDIKLHDIPNTVRAAAANCAAAGVGMLTVHASGGPEMLSAAVEGSRRAVGTPPKVIAVTILTSLDGQSLREVGFSAPVGETALRLARLGQSSGVDGVVVAAHEARQIRAACGQDFLIVTPGIRPHGHGADDQRRTVTPGDAVRLGADILVVGRPITRAESPVAAARRIVSEMASVRSE